MLTDEQIKKEWDEITHRVPPVCLNHFAHAIYKLGRADIQSECADLVDHILREGGGTYGDAIKELKP